MKRRNGNGSRLIFWMRRNNAMRSSGSVLKRRRCASRSARDWFSGPRMCAKNTASSSPRRALNGDADDVFRILVEVRPRPRHIGPAQRRPTNCDHPIGLEEQLRTILDAGYSDARASAAGPTCMVRCMVHSGTCRAKCSMSVMNRRDGDIETQRPGDCGMTTSTGAGRTPSKSNVEASFQTCRHKAVGGSMVPPPKKSS